MEERKLNCTPNEEKNTEQNNLFSTPTTSTTTIMDLNKDCMNGERENASLKRNGKEFTIERKEEREKGRMEGKKSSKKPTHTHLVFLHILCMNRNLNTKKHERKNCMRAKIISFL